MLVDVVMMLAAVGDNLDECQIDVDRLVIAIEEDQILLDCDDVADSGGAGDLDDLDLVVGGMEVEANRWWIRQSRSSRSWGDRDGRAGWMCLEVVLSCGVSTVGNSGVV